VSAFAAISPEQYVIARGQIMMSFPYRGHLISAGSKVGISIFYVDLLTPRWTRDDFPEDLVDRALVQVDVAKQLIDEALNQRRRHWLHANLSRGQRAAMVRWYGKP
jgi:hypothetical protein